MYAAAFFFKKIVCLAMFFTLNANHDTFHDQSSLSIKIGKEIDE